jgi:cysteinyl-tRNA synthetase
MQAAGEAVERLDALVRRAEVAGIDLSSSARDEPTVAAFRAAMDNDFGTPAAVAVIFDAVKRANVAIDAGDLGIAGKLVATVREVSAALGLEIGTSDADADSAEIDTLVAARDTARAARDFAEADRIRNELAARGVILEDTAAGTIWHR